MVGEYPRESCVMADFLVINQPSAFNTVLSRPSLKALKAITSIYHLLMKFPTPNRVGQVRGIRKRPGGTTTRPSGVCLGQDRSTSSISGLEPLDDTIDPRSFDKEASTRPIKDLVDLPVDNKEPTKVLKLRKKFSDELREAISTFLKENLDAFA